MDNFLCLVIIVVVFEVNKKVWAGIAIAVLALPCVAYLALAPNPPRIEPSATYPYSLRPREVQRLEVRAAEGDCDAAKLVSRYYFDAALDPDKAIEWQRMAAKHCPGNEAKVTFAETLINYTANPAADREIAEWVAKIHTTDPEKAAELEKRIREKKDYHY